MSDLNREFNNKLSMRCAVINELTRGVKRAIMEVAAAGCGAGSQTFMVEMLAGGCWGL